MPAWICACACACSSSGCARPAEVPALDHPRTVAIPVGALPVDLAAGDLDGDGALDLVSADAHDRALSVLLQRGATWARHTVEVGFEPHLVVLADLDGDRDLDLVATSHDDGAVVTRLNDGAARFTAAPGSPTPAFAVERPHNHGLVAGDLDGDGDTDVVVADQTQRALAVLLADATGRLTLAGPPLALGAEAYPPALGDLSGDGRLDLVVPLISSDALGLLLGDGAGGFAPAPTSPHRTGRARPYAIALGDLDHNGTLDVAAPHDDTSRITVLLNDGHAALRPAPSSPLSAGTRLWRPVIADLDGDSHPDLVGAGSGSLLIFSGDGIGSLRPTHRAATGGWTVLAADLDGDSHPDLAVPDQGADTVRLWLSRPAAAR